MTRQPAGDEILKLPPTAGDCRPAGQPSLPTTRWRWSWCHDDGDAIDDDDDDDDNDDDDDDDGNSQAATQLSTFTARDISWISGSTDVFGCFFISIWLKYTTIYIFLVDSCYQNSVEPLNTGAVTRTLLVGETKIHSATSTFHPLSTKIHTFPSSFSAKSSQMWTIGWSSGANCKMSKIFRQLENILTSERYI